MEGTRGNYSGLNIGEITLTNADEDFLEDTFIQKLRGSGVIPWQSYPKMIDKRYMKNGRSDTPCS